MYNTSGVRPISYLTLNLLARMPEPLAPTYGDICLATLTALC